LKKALLVAGLAFLAIGAVASARALLGAAPAPQVRTAADRLASDGFAQDALGRFSQALQLETVSHSPDSGRALDRDAFLGFRAFAEASYPGVHATLEREIIGGYGLLFRWRGTDEGLSPAIFMGHFDVVPVDPGTLDSWSHPPFAGVVADDYIWGRGTLDNKINVIGLLEAAERLVASGFVPKRTLYLSFGHDEELGGGQGAAVVAQRFRKRGERLALVIDEGGAVVTGLFPGLDVPVAAVGVAEKGSVGVELVVETEGGHSSMPSSSSAIGILATAVDRLEDNPLPSHYERYLRPTLEAVAPNLGFGYRLLLQNQWLFGSLIEAVLLRQEPAMREQGSGRILFVTSLAGCIGLPGETAYTASKFAVEGLAEGLSYEVKRFGIDVSIVAPAFFNTGMSASTDVGGHYEKGTPYDAFNEHIVASTTAGENAGEDPELVANMIVEAATTDEPRLRWWPGEQGPGLAAARRQMGDAEWQPMLSAEMKLGWWVEGKAPDAA
jgi:NAD(P)-dependent dehydrogenase (short-subunit alcohol dehydrogenase family)